jgi:hypothetical protein
MKGITYPENYKNPVILSGFRQSGDRIVLRQILLCCQSIFLPATDPGVHSKTSVMDTTSNPFAG